jgi:hypothetical protein
MAAAASERGAMKRSKRGSSSANSCVMMRPSACSRDARINSDPDPDGNTAARGPTGPEPHRVKRGAVAAVAHVGEKRKVGWGVVPQHKLNAIQLHEPNGRAVPDR